MLFFASFSRSNIVFKLSFIITAFTFCVSFGYGYDWINYFEIYDSINKYKVDYIPFEPGYYYVMKFMSYINAPFQLLHIFTTVLIFSLVYLFCKKMKNKSLSFFTLFSFMGFFMFIEQVRQGIAVCIIMLSVGLVSDGKKIKYFIMVLFAIFFHISAIAGLSYYLLSRKNNVKYGKSIYIIISVGFIEFILYAFENPSVISFIPIIGQKIFLYGLMGNSLNNSLFLKSSLVYIFLIILCFYFQRRESNVGRDYGKIDGSIYSSLLIWQTKAAFFLQRVQYYAVAPLIMGLDDYFFVRKKFSLSRIMYSITVLIIAYMPMRFQIYQYSITNPLFITASHSEIWNKIGRRCSDLLKVDDGNFIIKECN
ncbi:EpsG family protein [Dickeya fangzhongdai]|uniref:EpsG family protein n=1 Tax=Dickeya fangzhongdai TaxID=1778540 RepID=UPI001EFA2CAD|nr:EpsG family protein [Dickeya fangzhongdai]ULR32471.1 EpsG family protein [Dickeya fangzhongdai]